MIFGLREILVIALIAILSSSFWHSDSFVTESKKDQYTNDIFLSADKRMKAVRVHENGGPEALTYETDCPRPASAGAGEVVIRNNYAGINFIDTYHRSGLYQLPLPAVLGREGSGIIEEVGDGVTDFKKGDKVAYFGPNAYAELVALPADKVVPVPDGVGMDLAASIMLQGCTAHYLTHTTYPVQKGDTVLVHAGAGGTGSLIVQMAKLRGATVITTVSTEEKAKHVKALGADHVINYSTHNFQEEVLKITEGKKCNVVYDGVGKSTWEGSINSLCVRGYLVLFGNASGPVPPLNPLMLTKLGSLYVTRPTLRNHVATKEELRARTDDILGWIAEGRLTVSVAKVFPLADAQKAHEYLHSRAALGKILLEL